ncbi:MAG: metallophosphoesterase [Campylobacterota bacterium]|nr:metallophosphoesterase [Campylobacterota bacterium]
MDVSKRNLIKLSVVAAVSLVVGGCGDDNDEGGSAPDQLEVSIYPPDSMIECDARQITLKFSKPINPDTLTGNIYLSDKSGTLMEKYSVTINPEEPIQDRVLILLHEDFTLRESWRYRIVVTDRVESTYGRSMQNGSSLEFTTTSRHPFGLLESGETDRTKIVVISDLHMNEERACADGYSLFTQNGQLLEDFLEYVRTSDQIKELVILGDLLDMWVIPMAYDTLRDNITDTKAYFQSVANAKVNKNVIDKINQIADEGLIHFSYVPGNHDMLLSEDIFYTIFPKGQWRGENPGTGIYSPEPSVVLEHGHNYDLYNAPDSVTTAGSLLPPGYFITRIYATGNLKSTEKLPMEVQSTEDMSSELIYTTSWDIAVASINIPGFDPNKAQIQTYLDGYTQLYSSNEARDIYRADIGSHWKERQIKNGVRVPNSVIVGIMNGSGKFFWFGTLEYSAIAQYFTQDPKINIVVFGHTHHAMLKQNWETLDNVYANTGTWVDSQYLNDGALSGTCVILNTSDSSGSELDNVTLYQAVLDSQGEMSLNKIDEKNLERSST